MRRALFWIISMSLLCCTVIPECHRGTQYSNVGRMYDVYRQGMAARANDTCITLHFAGFSRSWVSSHPNWKSVIAFAIALSSPTLRLSAIVRSSTYFHLLAIGVVARASFINTRKIMGPSRVPCGTPPLGIKDVDRTPWYLVTCTLWCKKLQIHGRSAGRAPIRWSLLTAMLWFTKSKALLKSVITIVDTVCGLSALLCKKCSRSTR